MSSCLLQSWTTVMVGRTMPTRSQMSIDMERPKPLDDANSASDSTTSAASFVVLPDDAADSQADIDIPSQRPRSLLRWSSSIAILGRSSNISVLLSLASSGDETDARCSTQTTNESSSIRRIDNIRSSAAILHAVSSFLVRPSTVEKFRCYICYDDVPVGDAVTLTSCGHRYCQLCFESYLSAKISEGHVHPVCFHPVDNSETTTCGVPIMDEQIEAIVDDEVWTKFNRFRFKQDHKNARECPYCAFTQECKGPTKPKCVCIQCNKKFCFFHDNAHEYGTCADYELRNAEAEALNRAMIDKLAKPCPGCTRDIEKDGGCNHMKCVACKTSFCWLCGAVIDDVPIPSHFDRTKDGSCSGKQFDLATTEAAVAAVATESTWPGRLLHALGYVLMLPLVLLLTPITWYRRPQRNFWVAYKRIHYAAAEGFAVVVVMVVVVAIATIVGVLGFVFEVMIRCWGFAIVIAGYLCIDAIYKWLS